MHRRAILLPVLPVGIYAGVTIDRTPGIVSGQKALTEQSIGPDLQVPEAEYSAPGEGED